MVARRCPLRPRSATVPRPRASGSPFPAAGGDRGRVPPARPRVEAAGTHGVSPRVQPGVRRVRVPRPEPPACAMSVPSWRRASSWPCWSHRPTPASFPVRRPGPAPPAHASRHLRRRQRGSPASRSSARRPPRRSSVRGHHDRRRFRCQRAPMHVRRRRRCRRCAIYRGVPCRARCRSRRRRRWTRPAGAPSRPCRRRRSRADGARALTALAPQASPWVLITRCTKRSFSITGGLSVNG